MLTRSLALIFALLLAAASLFSCTGSTVHPAGKPVAVATIFSYYDALRAIGGDKITAVILLPARQSPHEFAASARNRDDVEAAKLVVKNGLGIDDWVDALIGSKKPIVLTIGTDASVLKTDEIPLDDATTKHEAESVAGNPHVWLDPLVQIHAAEKIRDALSAIDPADQATFDANAAKYITDIKALDTEFLAAAKTFAHKDFVGFHSAYAYLARHYGLRQVASIEEVPEAGLNAKQIDKVIAIIKKDHIPAVFAESALGGDAPKRIAEETSAKLGVLQPLETYDDAAKDSYVSLMRQNLESLKNALGQ